MAASRRRAVLVGLAILAVLVVVGVALSSMDSESEAASENPLPPPLAGRFHDQRSIGLRSMDRGLPEFWMVDHIPGNDELQRYRDDNVSLSHRQISMRAEQEGGGSYTSGAVNVGFEGEELVHPGDYVQARMRFPTGAGLWGALWLMPIDHDTSDDASTPEIDIVETVGGQRGRTQHFVHYDELDEGFDRFIDFSDWHTYGVWIADDGVHYFVDGIEIGVNRASPAPEGGAWGIIANLAIGGLAGDPSSSSFPAAVELSSLSVWS